MTPHLTHGTGKTRVEFHQLRTRVAVAHAGHSPQLVVSRAPICFLLKLVSLQPTPSSSWSIVLATLTTSAAMAVFHLTPLSTFSQPVALLLRTIILTSQRTVPALLHQICLLSKSDMLKTSLRVMKWSFKQPFTNSPSLWPSTAKTISWTIQKASTVQPLAKMALLM